MTTTKTTLTTLEIKYNQDEPIKTHIKNLEKQGYTITSHTTGKIIAQQSHKTQSSQTVLPSGIIVSTYTFEK